MTSNLQIYQQSFLQCPAFDNCFVDFSQNLSTSWSFFDSNKLSRIFGCLGIQAVEGIEKSITKVSNLNLTAWFATCNMTSDFSFSPEVIQIAIRPKVGFNPLSIAQLQKIFNSSNILNIHHLGVRINSTTNRAAQNTHRLHIEEGSSSWFAWATSISLGGGLIGGGACLIMPVALKAVHLAAREFGFWLSLLLVYPFHAYLN